MPKRPQAQIVTMARPHAADGSNNPCSETSSVAPTSSYPQFGHDGNHLTPWIAGSERSSNVAGGFWGILVEPSKPGPEE